MVFYRYKYTMITIIGSIAFLIGIGCILYGIHNIMKNRQSKYWPTTYGEIRKVELSVTEDSDGVNLYKNRVEYKYYVEGEEFISNNIAFGYTSSANEEAHRNIYEKIKKAKIVEVYYNPKNHKEAVMAPGINAGGSIWIILGSLIIMLILLIALVRILDSDVYGQIESRIKILS